jgi:hypothetical protein
VARVAYGVRIDGQVVLEGLPAAGGGELANVRVTLRRWPPDHEEFDMPPPEAELEIVGRPLSFHVDSRLEIRWGRCHSFLLSIGSSEIQCRLGPEGSLESLGEWLVHFILPHHLQMEHRLFFLHGGAVSLDGAAVGFLAPSGGGKSTLVEHFMQQGDRVLSDDKLAIVHRDGRILAVPATPFYRGAEQKTEWKRLTDFSPLPLPLRALYVLTPAPAMAVPAITPLQAAEATFALVRRCELRLPAAVRQRLGLPRFAIECLDHCTALAAAVPVRRLVVPRELVRLPEVRDAVLADLAVVR